MGDFHAHLLASLTLMSMKKKKITEHIPFYYIDTDEIPGFFLSLKNPIFIARGEDTILSFTGEDIGVAMVTNINYRKS